MSNLHSLDTFSDTPQTELTRRSSAILRRKQVQAETGYSRSTIYLRITQGLWPKPIRLGPRAVGWPAVEVSALNAARIAGHTDEEIRRLVSGLEAQRRTAAQPLRDPQ